MKTTDFKTTTCRDNQLEEENATAPRKWSLQDLKIMKLKQNKQLQKHHLVKLNNSKPEPYKVMMIPNESPSESAPNCAKCQLIVRWTSAQAQLTRSKHEQELGEHQQHQQACNQVANNKLLEQQQRQQQEDCLKLATKRWQKIKSQRTQTRRLSESGLRLAPFGCDSTTNHHQHNNNNNNHNHQDDSNRRCWQYSRNNDLVQRALNKQRLRQVDTCSLNKSSSQLTIDGQVERQDIGSLYSPDSSLADNDNDNELVDYDDDDENGDDQWSLSSSASCFETVSPSAGVVNSNVIPKQQQKSNQAHHHHRIVSTRDKHDDDPARKEQQTSQSNCLLPAKTTAVKSITTASIKNSNFHQQEPRYRRPAPAPPKGACRARRVSSKLERCDNSLDSGNTSGNLTDISRHSGDSGDTSSLQLKQQQQLQNQKPTGSGDQSSKYLAPTATTATTTTTNQQQLKTNLDTNVKPNLLTESEVFSIEHFLKSHKSSIYVCGCMANLYLTNTELFNNGRCSKPTPEGWQLSQTGVPVLTFDSGLTRNRDRRRLCINLAERGSGFVLWSDIIDHLSNYRTYSARVHASSSSLPSSHRSNTPSCSSSSSSSSSPTPSTNNDQESCDTFHVMYLSTNHRIMVGLSFDDATCAKLFLKQIELVTSDPVNISLTGPKLAKRLASVGRFGRLLTNKKRTKSIGSLQPVGQNNNKIQVVNELATTNSIKDAPKHIWASTNCLPAHDTYLEQASKIGVPRKFAKQQQHQSVSAKHSTKLTKLMQQQSSNAKRATTEAGAESSSVVDYSTWSTLKRAMKFGQQQSQQHDSNPLGTSRQQSVCASFKPKPLVSLAISGKTFRAGKKMPRKCDISAPCLFQHVTRVDLSNLEKLYTRSLVIQNNNDDSGLANKVDAAATKCSMIVPDNATNEQQSKVTRNRRSSNDFPAALLNPTNNPNEQDQLHHEQQGGCVGQVNQQHQTPVIQKGNNIIISNNNNSGSNNITTNMKGENCCQIITSTGSTFPMSSTNSTSSCYSSATSISPPSSECGATPSSSASTTNTGSNKTQPRYGQRTPRPSPPKVPQRTSSYDSSSTACSGMNNNALIEPHNSQRLDEESPNIKQQAKAAIPAAVAQHQQSQAPNKIQAIIRELQSQTSADLVDAKRKLMADIADQVVARAGQQRQKQQQKQQQQQHITAKLGQQIREKTRNKQHSHGQISEEENGPISAVSRL